MISHKPDLSQLISRSVEEGDDCYALKAGPVRELSGVGGRGFLCVRPLGAIIFFCEGL